MLDIQTAAQGALELEVLLRHLEVISIQIVFKCMDWEMVSRAVREKG